MTASPQQAPTPQPVAVSNMGGLRLQLLNGFELRLDGSHIPIAARSERLLAVLAVAPAPLSRAVIAGMLWPDATAVRALASVRSALWALPRLAEPLVRADGPRLALAFGVSTDLREASRQAAEFVADAPEADVDTALLCGDLLPTWSEDWIIIEQERFRQARLHALEALCVSFAKRGHYARAVEVGMIAVAADPLRETAHRALMAAHLAECNHAEALRQYRLYARLIKDELDLDPSPRMTAMVEFAPAAASIT